MSTERYLGEAALKDKPRKKLSLMIRDGSINSDKIANGSITVDKIADDVWGAIQEKLDPLTNPEIDSITDGSFEGGKIDLCGCTGISSNFVSNLQ